MLFKTQKSDQIDDFIKLGLIISGFIFSCGIYAFETTPLNITLIAMGNILLGAFLSTATYLESLSMQH